MALFYNVIFSIGRIGPEKGRNRKVTLYMDNPFQKSMADNYKKVTPSLERYKSQPSNKYILHDITCLVFREIIKDDQFI